MDTVGARSAFQIIIDRRPVQRQAPVPRPELSPSVRSARHALAIDETLRAFEPTLGKVRRVECESGKSRPTRTRPIIKWFPGVHSAVGGGAGERGLSDQALEWIWAGARLAGLELDASPSSRLYSLKPDFTEPLDGIDHSRLGGWARLKSALAYYLWRRARRDGGPTDVCHVSIAARRRWHTPAERLAERKRYRPSVLDGVAKALDADSTCKDLPSVPAPGSFDVYVVEQRDTLSKIALNRLGDAKRWPEVFGMNSDKLVDPNRIYCGMTLRVPKR